MIVAAILMYLVIKIVLLILAIGFGFLIHLIFPQVDLGMAILIGLIATWATINLYLRALTAIEEDDDEMVKDVEGERDSVIYRISPLQRPGRRKRKPRRNK
ncbi:MAG: hypothetical protein ACE5I1_27050 [bacterium]